MISAIHTARLDLLPMTPAFLCAALAGDPGRAEQLLPAVLPADWPGALRDVLLLRLAQLEADPSLQPWLLRGMVLRETGFMIGQIGFHAAPGAENLRPYAPDGVEFGFTVFPAFRRQGYAREASLALMQWARDEHRVKTFVLSIRPDNLPSQALARRMGFIRVGSHLDEVDGMEDILLLGTCAP